MFTPARPAPLLAAALILAAAVFIAATSLIAKALGGTDFGEPLHPVQISHGRFVFAFLAISATMAFLRPQLQKPHWRLHIARTSFGWSGVTLMFAAVAYIPLADATAITFLNPVFAMMLAIPLLGERVGPIRWLAAGLALFGAFVLLRPTAESFEPAALLALGAAFVMGFELIFIKKLTGRERPLQILLYNNGLGVIIASTAVIAFWQAPSPMQWGLLVAVGLCMAAAQAFFVNGMARADASFVAPFSYATLLFAAGFDAVIFAVLPDIVTLTGAALVISGAALLALRERKARRTTGAKASQDRAQ